MQQNVGEHLTPGNNGPWEEVRDRLNQKLKGWQAYFGLRSTGRAYEVIDEHVEERVRHFLRQRHKVSSAGHTLVLDETGCSALSGSIGSGVRCVLLVRESAMKPVGEPDA